MTIQQGIFLCYALLLFAKNGKTQYVTFAKWKDNAKGAYTVIHDDYGSGGVDGIWQIADSLYMERGLNFTFGAITSVCEVRTDIDGKGTSAYAKAVEMIMRGHEFINHSYNHNCAAPGYWNCSDACCWGIPEDSNENMAVNIDQSHQSILSHTNIAPQYYIYPYDVFTEAADERLKNLGYLGARTGSKRAYENYDFSPKLDYFFKTNFVVFNDTNSWSNNHDSILNLSVDYVLKTGSWANRELHNVGHGGWGHVRPEEYTRHLDYVKQKVDEGLLWMGTVSEVLVYQLQKHNFIPSPVFDSLSNQIMINWNGKNPEVGAKIESLFYKSPITVNVNLNQFKFSEIKIVQGGNEITDFVIKDKQLSVNCYPHKGKLAIAVDGLATGVRTSLNLSGLVIYNNPFSNSTTLRFNDGTKGRFDVSLMDTSGRIIEEVSWDSQQPLEIGNQLNSGLYLLKLAKGSRFNTVKFTR